MLVLPMDQEHSDLEARARFKPGDKVYWQAVGYTVLRRYWRKSSDLILYDLREINRPGVHPDMPKKVRESELDTD